MAFQDKPQGGFGPRQMFDVSSMNLKCAQCQTPITELPFQPDANRPVYCRECNQSRRRDFRGGGRRGGRM